MKETIYRQDAIDLINVRLSQPCENHTSEFIKGMEDGYCRIRSDIKCLPSAQPHWIPCSEKLPDERESVLCTDENGEIEVAYYEFNSWTDDPIIEWWSSGYRIWPIAWMPLPEPYGGEGNV